MTKETIVTIPRMNCNGCLKNVTKILQTFPSLAIIATDLPAKTLHLHYDPEQLSMEQIKTALGQAEYPIEKELPLVETQEGAGTTQS
ncbi:MAG TPA: heavy-metal-associated domain-containing protein [Ktedonobacteraceae bacterium]|jgi:copper chaperone CopZ